MIFACSYSIYASFCKCGNAFPRVSHASALFSSSDEDEVGLLAGVRAAAGTGIGVDSSTGAGNGGGACARAGAMAEFALQRGP